LREEAGEGVEGFCDGLAFGGCGLFEGFEEWVEGELGHAGGEEFADRVGGDQESDPPVGGVLFALDEALFDEAIDDSGDGAVGEADGVTELFEAETLAANELRHDETLRAGEVAASEFGLEALAHHSLNGVELEFGLLS
jgi:hypothetical protein